MSTVHSNNANVSMKRTYTRAERKNIHFPNKYSSCCVKSCPHYNKPSSLVLYPMPTNVMIKESWCKAFNIPKNLADDPNSRVCSLHFRSRSGGPPPIPPPSKPTARPPKSTAPPPKPIAPPPKTTAPPPKPKGLSNHVITVIINNNNYKVVESATALPSLNPPIPPDISQELSTRQNNLEKVKFLKEAISKIENLETDKLNPETTNSEKDADSLVSEQMVLEPDFSEIIELSPDVSVKQVSDQDADAISFEPEVILDSSNDCIEDKNEEPVLELECEDEQLSETQLDCYMKEMVEFLSANQTVYRLAQTSSAPKFPTIKSSEVDLKANNSVDNNVLTYIDGGVHPTSSALAPTSKLFPNSFLVSPFSKVETSKPHSPSFVPILPSNSSVTDITKKYSIMHDDMGKILSQNISSNLSVNGNVIFSKDLNINQSSNFPVASGTMIPVGTNPVLNNTSLPFVPNINMANFDWNNSNQVSQSQCSVLKNNQGPALSTTVRPKMHILTPISSVPQLKTMNSQPLNVISSQGNMPFILSPFVSSSKSLPSNVVFSFAPLTNSSEMKTVFSSAPMPPSSVNNLNGPFKPGTISSQPGFPVPQSTVYQIVNLPEAPKPMTLTNNLEQGGPVSFKPSDSTYQKAKHQEGDVPLHGESIPSPASKSDNLLESAGPSIQIVDVKGAKEGGAGEFFGESVSSIPSDNSKTNPSDQPLETLSDSDGVGTEDFVNYDESSDDDESRLNTISYESKKGKSEVTQMHAIYIIQEDVPVIQCKPGTMYLCPGDKTLFSFPRGEAKNRLSDSDDLRRKLKNAEFVTEAIPWMLKKKYLPSVPPCEKCGESILMLEKTNWLKFKEGYCYTCYNVSCHEKTPVKRCAFFDRFKKFSTECLLLLTYHWACMSPLQEIELDLDLDLEDVWSYFRALQHLCWIDNHKKLKLGSAYGNYVEAAVVRLGKYFVLGAYDRKTKFVRMDVLSLEEARKTMTTVKLLTDWLNPNSFLVCQKAIPKGLLRGIKTEVADPSVTDIRSTLPHTLNITLYLKRTLESMFGNYYHHTQTREFLGKMLAERQWREKCFRFGIEGAFWGILEVITEQNPSIGETTATIGIPSQKKKPYQPIDINNVCQLRWGPTFTERCTAIPNTYPSDSLPSWKETEPVKIQTYEKTRRPFTSSKSKGSVLSAKEKLDFKEKFQEVVSTASPSMKASPSMEQKDSFGSYELIKDKKSPFITLLQDLQEIRGSNNSLNFDAILSIKIQHLRRPKEVINYRRTAIELGTALRKEGFHSHPVKWLVKKNFINYVSKCYVCDSTAYLRDNNKFPDGCSWSCQNKECKFENIFRRPKFFARFPHQSMNHLLALVFHWIAQTKIDNILSDTSIDRQKIAHTWKAFQLKCNQTLHRENIKLGGPSHLVELAIVEHGKKYILGVYDRKSNLTAMKAYNKDHLTEEALFSFIETWLQPGTTVIVNARPTFPLPRNYYLKLASDRLLADYTVSYNVHLITRYLKTHLKNMFGKLNPMAVTPLFAQLYLDELMWRERFDTQPITSFSKLMQEIFIDEGIEKSLACEKLEEIIEDEHKEIPSLPVKLKEVRIVLKRIPQTVLKYYNCLDLASPQSSSVVKASSQNETTASKLETVIEVENDVEVEKDEELESIIDVENDPESSTSSPETDFPNLETTSLSDLPLTHAVFSEEVIATPSDPVFNRKKQVYQNDNDNSDEDYIADDSESEDDEEEEEEENSSADEFNPINMFRNFKWKSVRRRGTHSKGKTYSTYLKPDKSINLADTLDNFLFSDSSRNSNSTQSVQPLVINVCRKNKEPMFFIKSDSSATVSAAENSVDSNDGYVSESHPSSEFSLAESSVNLDIEPSVNTEHCINIKPCINIKSSLNIEPVVETIMAETKLQIPEKERKPISKLKRRLEEGLECVECGETLGFAMEHFMKKYQCSDCKNYVYTTCCSNSFFEHRGSLLFGKRMPKKLKRNFGLHKNASLPQPWFCKCGFTSSFGNKLASHLLKCPKSSGCVTTKK